MKYLIALMLLVSACGPSSSPPGVNEPKPGPVGPAPTACESHVFTISITNQSSHTISVGGGMTIDDVERAIADGTFGPYESRSVNLTGCVVQRLITRAIGVTILIDIYRDGDLRDSQSLSFTQYLHDVSLLQ